MKLMVLGKFGTGKTTVSDHVIMKHGFKRAMLATGLKKMADLIQYPNREWELMHLIANVVDASDLSADLIRPMHSHLERLKSEHPSERNWTFGSVIKFLTTLERPEFIKNRALLQEVGTQFRQTYHDEIWINYTDKKIVGPLVDSGTPVVVDDVRFKNEYDFLKARGFLPIRINSEWENRKSRLMARDGVVNEHRLNHISETDLDDYGEAEGVNEIHNDSTLEDLLSAVDSYVVGATKNVG